METKSMVRRWPSRQAGEGWADLGAARLGSSRRADAAASTKPIELGLGRYAPLDLTADDAKLVPEEKQLRFGVVESLPHIGQIKDQPQPGVHDSEEHAGGESYR
jgi:hypothetical protein